MTRATATHLWVGGNIANYKGTLQPLSDLLNALAPSLVKTADTGQVNWATTTTVPANATVRDYEVFRFTDALQATAPIFVRADYMLTTNALPSPRFTVGTGTDGAGTLTGVTTPALNTYSYTIAPTLPGSGSFTAYASSDGSQLMLVHGLNPAGTAVDQWGGIVIERFRNSDGSPNGEGYMAWNFDTTNTGANAGHLARQFSRVIGAGVQSPVEFTPSVVVPGVSGVGSYFVNNTSYAFPFYTYGPLLRGASQALLLGYSMDFPRCSEATLTHYGAPAKFLLLGSAANVQLPYTATAPSTSAFKTGFAPLLRWE